MFDFEFRMSNCGFVMQVVKIRHIDLQSIVFLRLYLQLKLEIEADINRVMLMEY